MSEIRPGLPEFGRVTPHIGNAVIQPFLVMSHNKYPQNEKPGRPAAELARQEAEFVPSPDEVARKAYFAFENNGSLPGHEVQHWLKAEAELIAERNRTRVHGFHNKT
jgi:hypothetical protein